MQRPTGVTVIAVIDFVGAGLLLLGALGAVFGGTFLGSFIGGMSGRTGTSGAALGFVIGAIIAVVMLFLAAVSALVGWGMLNLKEWARIVQIIIAAIGIISRLGSLALVHTPMMGIFGAWALVVLGYYIWVVYYLVQPQVRAAFQPIPVVPVAPPPPAAPTNY